MKFRSSSRTSSNPNLYKSLEDIQKNLENLDNFITITEDIMHREKINDFELYRRERERKETGGKLHESPSRPPPLSFKNGKIFCPSVDVSTFNPSNVQLNFEIVKQIINNQSNFLCYVSDDLNEDVNLSDEQDIFMTHHEEDNEGKLKSFNQLLLKSDSTISSKVEESVLKSIEEEILEFEREKLGKSDTMECLIEKISDDEEEKEKSFEWVWQNHVVAHPLNNWQS